VARLRGLSRPHPQGVMGGGKLQAAKPRSYQPGGGQDAQSPHGLNAIPLASDVPFAKHVQPPP
jgi:hypothetical protein